jgi:hypothetical protein
MKKMTQALYAHMNNKRKKTYLSSVTKKKKEGEKNGKKPSYKVDTFA